MREEEEMVVMVARRRSWPADAPQQGVAREEEGAVGLGLASYWCRAPPWKHERDLACPHPRWLMETAAPWSRYGIFVQSFPPPVRT